MLPIFSNNIYIDGKCKKNIEADACYKNVLTNKTTKLVSVVTISVMSRCYYLYHGAPNIDGYVVNWIKFLRIVS